MSENTRKAVLTVLTSATEFERGPILEYLRKRYRGFEPRFLHHLYADIALADVPILIEDPRMRYTIRDALQTRAEQIFYARVSTALLVVPLVAYGPEEEGYEECRVFAKKVQRAVMRLRIFPTVDLACLTWKNAIVPLA